LQPQIFWLEPCNQGFTAFPYLQQGVKQQGVRESLRDPKS
jgi:hypothetical protein